MVLLTTATHTASSLGLLFLTIDTCISLKQCNNHGYYALAMPCFGWCPVDNATIATTLWILNNNNNKFTYIYIYISMSAIGSESGVYTENKQQYSAVLYMYNV